MIVSRSALIAKLLDRLAGRIGADTLADWAADLFYALDQGAMAVNPEDAAVIAAVLDDLMFADDASFALDEADLRRLIARLQQP